MGVIKVSSNKPVTFMVDLEHPDIIDLFLVFTSDSIETDTLVDRVYLEEVKDGVYAGTSTVALKGNFTGTLLSVDLKDTLQVEFKGMKSGATKIEL